MASFSHWFSGRKSSSRVRRPEGLSRRRRSLAVESLEQRRVLAASSLLIYTTPQTVVAGTASGTMKIELLDQFGKVAKAPIGGQAITLKSSSAAGVFLNAAGTAALPGNTLVIPVGASSASFKYEDTAAGLPLITATSGALNPALQIETIVAAAPASFKFVDASKTPPVALPVQNIPSGSSGTVSIELFDVFGNVAVARPTGTAVRIIKLPTGGTTTTVLGAANGQLFNLMVDSPTGKFTSGTTQVTTLLVPTGQSIGSVSYTDLTPGAFHVIASSSIGQQIQLEITNGDKAPTITGPATLTVTQGSILPFTAPNQITVTDADGGLSESATLTVVNGSLIVGGVNQGKTVTLSAATAAALNTQLLGVSYQAPATGVSDALTVTTNDGFQPGATLNTAITLAPDTAPVLSGGPAVINTTAGGTVLISPVIKVADSDSSSVSVTVTLPPNTGSLLVGALNVGSTKTFTGTVAAVNAQLATLSYVAPASGIVNSQLSVTANDGALSATPLSIPVTSNQAPTLSVPNTVSVPQTGTFSFKNAPNLITVGSANTPLTVTLTATNGTFQSNPALGVLSGGGKIFTLTGSAATINTNLTSVVYVAPLNTAPPDSIQVKVDDGLGTPVSTVTKNIAVTITAVPAPTINAPQNFSVTKNTSIALSSVYTLGPINGGSIPITVTLNVSLGTFVPNPVIGVISNNNQTFTITDTLANLNAKIALVVYHAPNATVLDPLTISASDAVNTTPVTFLTKLNVS